MYEAFFAGRCDAMTQDASALAGALTVARDPAAYAVLEETISKEPLGPFTRNGDDQWSNIILWTALCAWSRRRSWASPGPMPRSARAGTDATAQRLLGASGEFGSRLGLDNRWACDAIRAVGNYGEVFERNVGEGSPLKLRRGLNGLWTDGRPDVRDSVPLTAARGGNDGNPQRAWRSIPRKRPRGAVRNRRKAEWTRTASRAPPSRSRAP